MRGFDTSIEILAPTERIWSVLTDAANWPTWNPTVTRVDGTIAAGQTVTVYTRLAPDRAFPVTVSKFQPGRSMVWSSGITLGLFKGLRTYTLDPQANGSVMFTMTETFSGLLAPIFFKSIPNMQPIFEEFATALKRYCEQSK